MRPPHIAQAPPCTAKQIQTNVKCLIDKAGGACAASVVLDHAARANEHCIGCAPEHSTNCGRRDTPSSRHAGIMVRDGAVSVMFMPSFREKRPRGNGPFHPNNSPLNGLFGPTDLNKAPNGYVAVIST